jgi:hypothetical protein
MSTAALYEDHGTSSKNVDDDKSVRLTVQSNAFERPISPSAFSDLSDLYGQDATVFVGEATAKPQTYSQHQRSYLQEFWIRNKGLVYVTLSQVFNCLMNVTITILEVEGNDGKGFHPLQVSLFTIISPI